MQTTIDSGGRVVIPKAVRDRLGLTPGSAVEITERDGQVVLQPVALEVRLVDGPHGVVAVTDRVLPPLDAAMVRDTVETLRR